MARTAPKNSAQTGTEDIAPTGTGDENVPAPATTEATEPEAPKAEEIDLSGFQAAGAAALGASAGDGSLDSTTSTAVVESYRALPGTKAKNEARRFVNGQMKDRMLAGDMQQARAAMFLEKQLDVVKPAKAAAAPKAPVDPTADFVSRVAAIQLAYTLISTDVPEGVSAEWTNQVNSLLASVAGQVTDYKAWLANVASTPEGTEAPAAPEVNAVITSAFKLARAKTGKGSKKSSGGGTRQVSYEGPRRSVVAHISAAFDGKPVGTFLKVSEISAATSAEYGDDHPTGGAVHAQLKSWVKSGKRPIAGLDPETRDGLFGAIKTA